MNPLIARKNEGTAFWLLNSLILIKSAPADTGSGSAIFQQTIPPGYSTPYHRHQTSDDSFYLLDGQVTFFSDGQKLLLDPGDYIFLPHGFPHGFRNDSPNPASMLFIATQAKTSSPSSRKLANPPRSSPCRLPRHPTERR